MPIKILIGNSDVKKLLKKAEVYNTIFFLQNGKLYECLTQELVHYFNKKFNMCIPSCKGYNIHDETANGDEILKYLEQPIDTCKWCAYEIIPFPWSISDKLVEEWDAFEQKKYL